MKQKIFLRLIATAIVMVLFVCGYHFFHADGQDLKGVREEKAKIISIDSSEVIQSGAGSLGYQEFEMELLSGTFKGSVVHGTNTLYGQVETDNIYKAGDKILAAIKIENNKIVDAKAIELYRQNWIIALFLGLIVLLLIFAGVIGLKAILSFVLSVIVIWEILIRGLLDGQNPLYLTTLTVILLTAIIIFLVAGINKKGLSAFLGTIFGLIITMMLTLVYGQYTGLFGLTQPYVQTLIISGYYHLNIQQIFYSAIILGASGAAMDVAMDISASMSEIKEKKHDISKKELILSGFNVGKHVIGTMTTTLLLAYSGGYLTLLMVFMLKDTSFLRMINLKIVSAEIIRTLIGSLGLVMVAPITAVIAGILISKKSENSFKITDILFKNKSIIKINVVRFRKNA